MAYARYENLWGRLLVFLNEWSSAREIQPGRVAVELQHADGTTRVIEVLMTQDQWDEMVSVLWGGFGRELQHHVRERVLGLGPDERYLIYSDYDLAPSSGETLPEDPDDEWLAEMARHHPAGFGRWFATDKHGNAVDEYQAREDPSREPPDDPTSLPSR